MNVLTMAIAFEEALLLPYFIRHYRQLGDVMIVDDHSTDGTADVAQVEGARVLPIEHHDGEEVEHRLLRTKNHAWKQFREQYDWVIIVDIDEYLYHPDGLNDVLLKSKERGTTLLVPTGYMMISYQPPVGPDPLFTQFRRGVHHQPSSKPCCFNPSQIIDINFAIGAHTAEPTGDVHRMEYPGLKLLHYHYLGLDWVMSRYAARKPRRLEQSEPCWVNYRESVEQVAAAMAKYGAEATEVI
jgi:glycosyltransferase involved in cell wall biosynthesis